MPENATRPHGKSCVLCVGRATRIAELRKEIETLQSLVDECELMRTPEEDIASPTPRPPRVREDKSLRHQVAALTRWSRESGKAQAEKMQAGLLEKFRREVVEADPDVVEPELTRRAECARAAHMRTLALKSAKVRAARKEVSR